MKRFTLLSSITSLQRHVNKTRNHFEVGENQFKLVSKWKLTTRLQLSFALLLILFSLSIQAQKRDEPQYASAKSKELIEKMINAHGGMKSWDKVKTVSFDYLLWVDSQQLWYDQFEMTDRSTLRSYQKLRLPQEAEVGYDGEKWWSKGDLGIEPARSRINFHFSTITLPWKTQDISVRIGEPGTARLPILQDNIDYLLINIVLPCSSGCTTDGHRAGYQVYIDPQKYLIKAIAYSISYGGFLDAMKLPKEMKTLGPLIHIYQDYLTVDGLVVPRTYSTVMPDGKFGVRHLIRDLSWSRKFDESKMKMPTDAKIDTSSPTRSEKND